LSPKEFKAVVNCSKGKVALPSALDPMELSGLAWMSDATFKCGDEEVHRLVGPACCGPKGWFLPILAWSEEDLPLEDYQGSAEKYRKHFGFNAVRK